MADQLKRLVDLGSFNTLQDKLDRWLEGYYLNTCDQNTTRCCEIIELNARVQAQLFKLLSITSAEGGTYGGSSVIKSRLLPWLGSGVFASAGLGPDSHLTVLAEAAAKDRELEHLQDAYERSLKTLEDDLIVTRDEAADLRNELERTRSELNEERRRSTSEKMFTESEIRDLRTKLRTAEDEVDDLRFQLGLRPKPVLYNSFISTKKLIVNGDSDGLLPTRARSLSPLPRPTSPYSVDDLTQRSRQQRLISRFNDLFIQDRLDSMDTLRRFIDDYENNQKIVFTAVQESFTTAKLAFADFKQRVRSTLAVTHLGPESLEEAVQLYINRNPDSYDLASMVAEVVRVLNRNTSLILPSDISFSVISPLIREALKMAWGMASLAIPMDIALATCAELFDDVKYRRTYDSEYSAPLVNHHIWPCLMQSGRVVVKGEACTRRGASLSPRASRSSLRSSSPIRGHSVSPYRSTSPRRSLSPRRTRSPSPTRSGRLTPSIRSGSASRALTTSTRLSHYGVAS